MKVSAPRWLRALATPFSRKRAPFQKPKPYLPRLETLEDRLTPALAYFNDFETAAGSEWSNTSISTTPVGNRDFLGEFSNQNVSLSLTGLEQHNRVTLSFDVYVLRSWDGNSNQPDPTFGTLGPDVFNVTVNGGPALVNTTFSNHFDSGISPGSTRQAYPDAFGDGDYAAGTGAAETNTLGYTHPVQTSVPMDSVYHITVSFDHIASSVQLDFSASGLQVIGDESWGLDNVRVETSYLPKEYVPGYSNTMVDQAGGLGGPNLGQGASCPAPDRLADGAATTNSSSTSFSSSGLGRWLSHLLTYTNSSVYTTDTANGSGQRDIMMPSLRQADGDNDTIVALIGGTDAIYFDLNGGTYTPRFFGQETLTYDSGSGLFTLADTTGNQFTFHDFDAGLPAGQRGQIQSIIDPAGNVTDVISRNAAGRPTEIQRSEVVNGETITESFLYTYVASGANAGLVESATLRRRVDSGPWDLVRAANYSYYENSDAFGNDGDLKLAVMSDATGEIDRAAYRYYDGESGGFVHGLKYVFHAASYARLTEAGFDPFTSTDSQVSAYADLAMQYDAMQRLSQLIAQGEGCSACSAGQGTYTYSYFTSAHPEGHNSWRTRTTETLPDGSVNTVYTNAYGQEMLRVFTDVTTDLDYLSYTRYDDDGRTILTANPSAISGFDESKKDLLDLEAGNYQFLRDDAGLITTFSYYTTTTAGETTAGGAAGYLQSSSLQRGELGTPVLQASMTYFVHSGGGATVVPLASSTVYRSQARGSDAGFEAPDVGSGTSAYQYTPSGSAWTFVGGAGLSGNDSGFTSGNPAAPQGTQVAFVQDGGSLSQDYFFDAGTYTLSFLAAQRQNFQPGGPQTVEVFLDSVSLGTFTPGSASYALQTTGSFTVAAGTHTLAFVGVGSGDATAFLDDVQVAAVSGAQTTSFDYTFFTDSTRIASISTALPVVSAAQNGPGTADVMDQVFDADGRLHYTRDADGYINRFTYDVATGALIETIVDVNTALVSDEPAGWTTPVGGGLHLITSMEVDNLGRTTKLTLPNGNVTYTVFDDANHETRNYRGWDSATQRPTGPTEVYREDRPGSYVETLTMSAAPDVDGSGRPTGTEAIGEIQTLSRSYISAGGQVTHTDDYFFIQGGAAADAGFETPSVGTGFYSAFAYNPSGGAWLFNSGSGVAGNGSGFTSGNPNAPEGTQVAFLQSVGSSISQSVALAAGSYTISFAAAQRQNFQPAGNQSFQVVVDGAVIGTFTPGSTSYATSTTAGFTVDAGVHTIAFVGLTTGDSTAFLDQITVNGTAGLVYSTDPDIGVEGVHFYRSDFDYDKRGRQNRTVTPTDTIYRTEYDGVGRVVSTWVGTDDTPTTGFWSPSNLAGTDMVQTSAYVYDNGLAGDSNLTEATALPGGSEAPRVSRTFFDWRNRAVATKSGVETSEASSTQRPIFYTEFDNLGQAIVSEQYDGDGVTIVDANDDGVPDKPDASLLRAKSTAEFDDQGRAFRTHVFLVDQSTGAVSTDSLTSDYFFDQRGNVIKMAMPGGLVSKSRIDGAGRTVQSFTTDGGGDSSWADADDVTGDIVLEQSEVEYDANSNVQLTTFKRRFHDEPATGELGDATTGPKARVSYVAAYYDLADRLTDSVNVGTNGGTAYTRASSVPARSDTDLVSSMRYNEAGWVSDTIDPRGIVAHTDFDALGRSVRTIQAFVDGTPSAGDDRTMAYTYDGSNHTLTVTTRLPGGAHQTTGYVYNVRTGTGSNINSNDILSATQYPDATTGDPSSSEQDIQTVNALGETKTFTDRNGSTHTLTRDVLGRIVADAVTTLGAGVDGAVRRIETAYDTAGRAFLFTSFDAASGGNIVNQVQREFNGFGQLTAEYQEHAGAVNTGTSPKVQYTYSEMAGGANHSRLTSIIYPNGRVVTYNYASGLDDSISRLSSISDTSATLEALSFLGLGTVVKRAHPEAALDLTYIKMASESVGDAGDQYTGLDRFDRVVDQRWVDSVSGVAKDRFQYGYDRDSNRLYRENLVNVAFSELYHANGAGNGYDLLNQLTAFSRGTLNSSKDAISGASRTQTWDLDAVGNWSSVTTDSTTETRNANAQNEYTSISGATAPAYDANGNMTGDETGKTLVYDAWNRLVAYKNGSTTLTSFSYDALLRRVTENPGTLNHLYYSGRQVIEERLGTDTIASVHYVWSPVYDDALVARDRNTDSDSAMEERLYVAQDANWNVTSVVDTSGAVTERYVYDAYGLRLILSSTWSVLSSSSSGWLHGYQGLRLDVTMNLMATDTRWVSPSLGRPISLDPIGFEAGFANWYIWVGNNPATWTDPSGTQYSLVVQIAYEEFLAKYPQLPGNEIQTYLDFLDWFKRGKEPPASAMEPARDTRLFTAEEIVPKKNALYAPPGFRDFPHYLDLFENRKVFKEEFPNLEIGQFKVIGAINYQYDCHNYALNKLTKPFATLVEFGKEMNAAGYSFLAGVPLDPADGKETKLKSSDFAFVKGQQKIVIYGKPNDEGRLRFTHSAVQNPERSLWESKLGGEAVIAHRTLGQIAGGLYGEPISVYVRKTSK